jgi:LAO/AO transport system kinase
MGNGYGSSSSSLHAAKLPPARLEGVSTREIGRLLSRVENGEAATVLAALAPAGCAHVVGITGPPGVGKSTLVDKLIEHVRRDELRVAVLAVDPSSPFSGGAILGDRVRMNRHAADRGVFIRSMAARRALGGLAAATRDAIRVLDAAGYDLIVLETVGVGQNELDVVRAADTVLVLVAPGLGDAIQALKAGVLEIADVFVVNGTDRPGADRTVVELRGMLALGPQQRQTLRWQVPIVETVATTGQGVERLWATVGQHRESLGAGGELQARRRERIRDHVLDLLFERFRSALLRALDVDEQARQLLDEASSGQLDPHQAAERIFSQWQQRRPTLSDDREELTN